MNGAHCACRRLWGVSMDAQHVVELDSSTVAKWSRHVIVTLPGRAFASTADVGAFVRGHVLRHPLAAGLLLPSQHLPGGAPASIVDIAVYSRCAAAPHATTKQSLSGQVLELQCHVDGAPMMTCSWWRCTGIDTFTAPQESPLPDAVQQQVSQNAAAAAARPLPRRLRHMHRRGAMAALARRQCAPRHRAPARGRGAAGRRIGGEPAASSTGAAGRGARWCDGQEGLRPLVPGAGARPPPSSHRASCSTTRIESPELPCVLSTWVPSPLHSQHTNGRAAGLRPCRRRAADRASQVAGGR